MSKSLNEEELEELLELVKLEKVIRKLKEKEKKKRRSPAKKQKRIQIWIRRLALVGTGTHHSLARSVNQNCHRWLVSVG